MREGPWNNQEDDAALQRIVLSHITSKESGRQALLYLELELEQLESGLRDARKAAKEATEKPLYPWADLIKGLPKNIAAQRSLLRAIEAKMRRLP